jgi:hypothetical protein
MTDKRTYIDVTYIDAKKHEFKLRYLAAVLSPTDTREARLETYDEVMVRVNADIRSSSWMSTITGMSSGICPLNFYSEEMEEYVCYRAHVVFETKPDFFFKNGPTEFLGDKDESLGSLLARVADAIKDKPTAVELITSRVRVLAKIPS